MRGQTQATQNDEERREETTATKKARPMWFLKATCFDRLRLPPVAVCVIYLSVCSNTKPCMCELDHVGNETFWNIWGHWSRPQMAARRHLSVASPLPPQNLISGVRFVGFF